MASFEADWLKKFTDPYALLGVSVSADERRILKRYRVIAKLLHPDSFVGVEQKVNQGIAGQIFARLVSPAYKRINQEQGRAETLAMLRLGIRQIAYRQKTLDLQTEAAQKILKLSASDAEVFYEQAIGKLAEQQYTALGQFDSITHQLAELNQAFLYVKMGEFLIREKRVGIVSSVEAKPIQFTPVDPEKVVQADVYAQRHYERAQLYVEKGQWLPAVQELREAIRLENKKSEYHALIGFVYLQQKFVGMAGIHFRQALKLNPQEPLALEHLHKAAPAATENKRSQTSSQRSPQKQSSSPQPAKTNAPRLGFFGFLFGNSRVTQSSPTSVKAQASKPTSSRSGFLGFLLGGKK